MANRIFSTALLSALLLSPLTTLQAAPPPWAGNPNAAQERTISERQRQPQGYRYSEQERQLLQRRLDGQRSNLPPGLQKKVARGGNLPPGWQRKLQGGQRLPDDLYYSARPIPVYDDMRRIHGVSDVIIDNEVIRVIDATQTIIDVFSLGG